MTQMPYLVLKVAVSALVVVAVAEIAKRSSVFGALVASLPLTSLLAFVWLYVDTGDTAKVSNLATGIFWLVLPSLVLFVVLPLLLRSGWGFWSSLLAACGATVICYGVMVVGLRKLGLA